MLGAQSIHGRVVRVPLHDGGQGGHDGDGRQGPQMVGRRVNKATGCEDVITKAPTQAQMHESATSCRGDGKAFVTKGRDQGPHPLVAHLNPLVEIRDR